MIMPLVLVVMFFAAPAGLNLYWLASNLCSIVQQARHPADRRAPGRAPAAAQGAPPAMKDQVFTGRDVPRPWRPRRASAGAGGGAAALRGAGGRTAGGARAERRRRRASPCCSSAGRRASRGRPPIPRRRARARTSSRRRSAAGDVTGRHPGPRARARRRPPRWTSRPRSSEAPDGLMVRLAGPGCELLLEEEGEVLPRPRAPPAAHATAGA